MDIETKDIVWRRHARAKKITLRIDPSQGRVVVTLPLRVTRSAGMALLNEHAVWVAERLAALPDVPRFADGADLMIDGVKHVIRHAPGRRGGAWLEGGTLYISGDQAFLVLGVTDFLRDRALRQLSGQAIAKGAQAGLVPRRVTVKDTHTRWGSCSARGVLMFSWRLLMAPPFVQDYVVAHEVAHLRHLDHGPDFWSLADALSPHRAAAVSWLAQEGSRLLRVGLPCVGMPRVGLLRVA